MSVSRNPKLVDIPDQLQSTSIGYSRFKKKRSHVSLERTEKINMTSNTKLDTTKPDNNTTKPDMDAQKRDSNETIVTPKINTSNTASPYMTHKMLASQRWKKISGVIKSIANLRSHEIKSIYNEGEIDVDLQDYQTRLLPNTKEAKKEEGDDGYIDVYEREMEYIHGALSSPKNDEMFKSKLFDIIVQGEDNKEAIKKIETIFKLCQHERVPHKKNPEYFLNKHFINGKNLFYIACQEGKIEIVRLFLQKELDPKIYSKVDEYGEESPLECACRWGYKKIVELLLDKVYYSKKEIENVLKISGLSKNIILLLKKSMKDKMKKEGVFCFC